MGKLYIWGSLETINFLIVKPSATMSSEWEVNRVEKGNHLGTINRYSHISVTEGYGPRSVKIFLTRILKFLYNTMILPWNIDKRHPMAHR